MQYSFVVENIRCGGCVNTITKKLTEINQVKQVDVNIEEQKVIVNTGSDSDSNIRQILCEKLAKLGYPEMGTTDSNGIMTKAASVVSCAIGKISDKS